MDTGILLAFLVFFTLGAVVVFAWVSHERTEARRHKNTPRSTLAADAPDSMPPGQRPPDV